LSGPVDVSVTFDRRTGSTSSSPVENRPQITHFASDRFAQPVFVDKVAGSAAHPPASPASPIRPASAFA